MLRRRATSKDLVVREHAATVVMSGDAAALLAAGDELTWCGEEVVCNRDIRRYGGPALRAQFDGDNDGGWECLVMAEDRMFRRRARRSA
ncbi:MAG TPA: hypothetical protein VFC19_38300 [Candidatus Limnocylindrales bacterium]|nr:hypothetical protein [Candidatus Limnocylindrales bacterium]